MPTPIKVQNLNIHIVASQAVYEYMEANGLIEEYGLYLILGEE